MYKKTNLSVASTLMIGLFITGCSQQPIDLQPAPALRTAAIDAQIQNVVTPEVAPTPTPPKVYPQPRPPKRMVKPIQRMPKPIQRPRMIKPVQRMMSKPIQRQY